MSLLHSRALKFKMPQGCGPSLKHSPLHLAHWRPGASVCAAGRGCVHGSEDVFHALFLQFLVILWSIYTNIKNTVYRQRGVVSSGPGVEQVFLCQAPGSGVEVWGKQDIY